MEGVTAEEEWRAIPGWEGTYEVSDRGRVRSLDRYVFRADGRRERRRGQIRKSHALPHTGHMNIKLRKDGVLISVGVHTLVAAAFIGPRPEGLQVCHDNGIPSDNRPGNLRYDTVSNNQLDAVRHGTHNMSSKTHCKWGHPFDDLNTIYRAGGYRECATCRLARQQATHKHSRLDEAS